MSSWERSVWSGSQGSAGAYPSALQQEAGIHPRWSPANRGKPDMKPERGDLIEILRGFYEHWAVYVGDGYVVHLVAPNKSFFGSLSSSSSSSRRSKSGQVLKEKLKEVVGDDYWKVNNLHDDKWKPRPPQEIVEEALSWVDKDVEYNVFGHNCEHFATLCRYGKEESRQLLNAVKDPVGLAVKPLVAGLFRSLMK